MLYNAGHIEGESTIEKCRTILSNFRPLRWCEQYQVYVGGNVLNPSIIHILEAKYTETDYSAIGDENDKESGCFVFDDKLNLVTTQ